MGSSDIDHDNDKGYATTVGDHSTKQRSEDNR